MPLVLRLAVADRVEGQAAVDRAGVTSGRGSFDDGGGNVAGVQNSDLRPLSQERVWRTEPPSAEQKAPQNSQAATTTGFVRPRVSVLTIGLTDLSFSEDVSPSHQPI